MTDTGATYEQLDTAFRHRNFKPLYFLFGEEGFLIDELQARLIEHALERHERDFNLDLIYGAEAEAQRVLATCAAYPVMAQHRVVIVRDFDKLKQNKLFESYAERPNPQAIVMLLCSAKPNLSTNPYRLLKAHAVWGEFKPLQERQMPGWVQQRVKAQGYKIEEDALGMLVDRVGNSLRVAASEIEKLITYAGEHKILTASHVIDASGQTREFNVFELQRAVGERRYADAMRITERLLQQTSNRKGEAVAIVAVLSGFFTRLRKLAACQARRLPEKAMAERIGVRPYFVKEYLLSLQSFDMRAIDRAFEALLAADYELKGGGSRDERLVLALLMRRLISHPASVRVARGAVTPSQ